MQCFRFLQKGHPVSHCTKISTNTKSDKQSDGGNMSWVTQVGPPRLETQQVWQRFTTLRLK